MGRIAFFLLLALVVYLAIKMWRRAPPRRSAGEKTVAMLRCEHCGVYLPRSEAIQELGHNYCSAEHQRAARK